VPNLSIEERLLHYFLAMGAQQIDPFPNAPKGLSLLIGQDRTHVTIIGNGALTERNGIIQTILSLTSLRSIVHSVYLAVPRFLGATIDASVFRSHGIGLILFDDRRIEEIVTPQPIQRPVETPRASDGSLINELSALRLMCLEMQRELAELRQDMKRFHARPTLPPSPSLLPTQSDIAPNQDITTISRGQLPSFFTNNPWLEVLSKRGRVEEGPVAG